MAKSQIIGFFSLLTIPSDASDEEEIYYEKLADEFQDYLWGKNGINKKLEKLNSQIYGNDICLILFEFNLFSSDISMKASVANKPYRPKEKSYSVPIEVNSQNFFEKTEPNRNIFLHTTILDKLEQLALYVKANNLDTKIDKLITDVRKLIGKQ